MERQFNFRHWAALILANRDFTLALAVIAIISMLILPMPAWLLDFGLSISITFSVLILLTVLFIEKPLELSGFPTILLIITMLRLGLNLASTRLILGNGHEGPDSAGGVIGAFGEFLMGGQTVIGLTIFLILVIINFVVITKGAGRIAEVAARFSLDSMPGKQMAIDADLNAGIVDEHEARARRTELEAESGFFGAMDGASKFVKGEAIAGLLITGVNILVGIIVGTTIHDVDFSTAFHTYTLLTVGDGLVSQIPALIVSIAAGLLVSKGGMAGKAGIALSQQLGRYPQAIGIAGALMLVFGVIPGLPLIPFATIGGLCLFAAWKMQRLAQETELAASVEAELTAQKDEAAEEPVSAMLSIDSVRIELGYGLLPIIDGSQSEPRLDDQVRALRRQLATDYGFVLPQVRILDNMTLGASDYIVYIRETEAGRGEIRLNKLMVINPTGESTGLAGEATKEPVFGLPALWIERDLRDEAGFRNLTVVDGSTVVTTHLTEIIKDNLADLLSYAETQKLLTEVHTGAEKLMADLVPQKITVSGIQRILQNLLSEGVSIRDMPTILEGVAEAVPATQNLGQITEYVRVRLSRQICAALQRDGALSVVTLSPEWEMEFAEAIRGEGDAQQLALAPSLVQEFIAQFRILFDRLASEGEIPCILTSPTHRPFLRSIIERVRPATMIVSQNEIHPRVRIRSLGAITRRAQLGVAA